MAKYFNKDEFKCACCSEVVLSEVLLNRLDRAREIAGIPFSINSGYRCAAHNEAIGSSATSSHVNGYAADISATTGHHRFLIIDACIKAGFNRIGIHKSFIHVDVDPNKSAKVAWMY